ncbi:Septum formation initiator [Terricaulis silvestris]|uniref:Septum formation initiator n=2 Tax=Terricaulis silvestris TaxID=2686094 RepID=A0A6I6MMB3_9CAUL|nr:Septum formation initiator [Terricaulis silvestris]
MSKRGTAAMSIALGAGILYLGAHAVTGRQGLVAYVDLQAQERALEQRVAGLEEEHADLEARAARLRPETLDLDYLDERARITLAAGDSDELVFALDP